MTYDEFAEKVKSVGGKPGLLSQSRYKKLFEMILENEILTCASEGLSNAKPVTPAVFVVTEKNLYVVAGDLVLKKNSIPLNKIASISTFGLLGGRLRITEGTVMHEFYSVNNMDNIIAAIKKGQSVPESQNITPATSAADELRKFKTLLDDGIISQTEFDKKKAELLK